MPQRERLPLAVGATVWRFDENRRIYNKPTKPGQIYSSGPPIWREHWVPYVIDGETSRSWLIGANLTRAYGHYKLPKVGPLPRGWAISEAEIDQAEWVQSNKYKLCRAVEYVTDYTTLRAIAELIGYDNKEGRI